MKAIEAIEILDNFFERYPERYSDDPFDDEFWKWIETLSDAEKNPFKVACQTLGRRSGTPILGKEILK